MPNTLLTPTKIAREAIMLLKNRLGLCNKVHRDYIKDMYDPKSGGAVTIRKPVEFSVTSGATLVNEDVGEYSVVIPAPTQKHVSFRFTSAELTLTIEDFSRRYISSAVTQLVNDLEYDLLGLYTQIPHVVGTPGTHPNSFSSGFAAAAQRLDEMGVESADRCLVLSPAAQHSLTDAMKGLFSTQITEDAVRRNELGRMGNFDVFMSQNVRVHTTGTFSTGSTSLTNGVSSDGDLTIVTDGWANSTAVLTEGDVFTVSSVNDVQPRNKQDLGRLKQFVATAAGTSDGSGDLTITVDPDSGSNGLQDSGARQNISAHIADGATVSVWGANGGLSGAGTEATAYQQNLAWHKNWAALVFFNIETPQSADGATVTDPETGLAIRMIRDYDVTNDREVYRLDILRSLKVLDQNRCVRVVGGS